MSSLAQSPPFDETAMLRNTFHGLPSPSSLPTGSESIACVGLSWQLVSSVLTLIIGCQWHPTIFLRWKAAYTVASDPCNQRTPNGLGGQEQKSKVHALQEHNPCRPSQVVFKSPVLGPQKDRRLNQTGPKKDRIATAVWALLWSVQLRLHEFEGNAKTGPRPVATGFIEDWSYVSVHRVNSMQISIPVYLWEYMVVFNILYVTYT